MRRPIRFLSKKILNGFGRLFPRFNARMLFLARTHQSPKLKNPQTFNEKTTWLKLNDYNNNRLASKCADKYEVREYVKSKECSEILNGLYGVYDDFDEIDFNKLPRQFVIKCTHGCAYNIIVKDKANFDINKARKKIKKWQKEKYGYTSSELHYTKITPRIIVERYLCTKDDKMPVDYKFYCMNGEIECVLVCSEREDKLRLSYYDKKWDRLPYEKESWSSKRNIEKPKNLDKMLEYAKKLGEDFPFVRVDLYNDNGRIIFGELTFTPACSCAPYYTREADLLLGKKLELFRKSDLRSLQHIVATVDNDGEKLYKRMGIKTSAIIANQNKKEESLKTLVANYNTLKIVNTKLIGVGKNRNMGLLFADADICILSDDDMIYDDYYSESVTRAFTILKDADVIVFDINLKNTNFIPKPIKKIKRVRGFNYMRYGGSRFAFRTQSIKKKNIWFTDLFGGGAKYSSGEDTIFLKDCLKAGLHVYMIPVVIATVDCKESSWYFGKNEKFFYDKGALLYVNFPFLYFLLIFHYAKKTTSDFSYTKKVKLLLKGAHGYKNSKSYDDYLEDQLEKRAGK